MAQLRDRCQAVLLSQDETRFPLLPTLRTTLGLKGHDPLLGAAGLVPSRAAEGTANGLFLACLRAATVSMTEEVRAMAQSSVTVSREFFNDGARGGGRRLLRRPGAGVDCPTSEVRLREATRFPPSAAR